MSWVWRTGDREGATDGGGAGCCRWRAGRCGSGGGNAAGAVPTLGVRRSRGRRPTPRSAPGGCSGNGPVGRPAGGSVRMLPRWRRWPGTWGCRGSTIWAAVVEYGTPLVDGLSLDGVSEVGFDEHRWRCGWPEGKWAMMVSDLTRGRVVDILQGRSSHRMLRVLGRPRARRARRRRGGVPRPRGEATSSPSAAISPTLGSSWTAST